MNQFFHLLQQNKSYESKETFRQASNHCKGFFEAAKDLCANKIKESITSQKVGELLTLFSTKVNLL